MENIFEEIKKRVTIQEVVERIGNLHLDRSGKALCPFHREKTPSFSIKKDENIFKCFGCGESGDAIHFVAKLKGIEPIEAAKLIAEVFNIDIKETKDNWQKQSIKEYLKECISNVNKTDYFEKRGLNSTTIKKYYLGYDVKRNAVVIPYSSKLEYYQLRCVADKSFFKPRTEEAGPEPIYNTEALQTKSQRPVFVVESPICALSIMQQGEVAVSLCGTTGTQKLINILKASKYKGPLILCLDNDAAGQAATQTLSDELNKIKAKHIVFDIAKGVKDPNEKLMVQPGIFKEDIKKAVYKAKKTFSTWKEMFDMEELEKMTIKPLEWLVEEILPVGLIMLASPPKLGKSWMMLQLCMSIVQGKEFLGYNTNKNECVYLALEDTERRFRYRKRKLYGSDNNPKGFSGFTDAASIKIIREGFLDQLKELIALKPRTKLIVVDTFQMVRGVHKRSDQAYSLDSEDLKGFRSFVNENDVGIMLIHHTRKMHDDNDPFNMPTGTTGLTGVVDATMVLGKKKRDDPTCSLSITGRDIRHQTLELAFDDKTNMWSKVETSEEAKLRAEKEEYEKNPIVITIKELLKRKDGIWRGTARDLIMESIDMFGGLFLGSEVSVGKKITELEYKLRRDKIQHEKLRNRVHEFKYATQNLWNYTRAPKEND